MIYLVWVPTPEGASGHVGLYAGHSDGKIKILGGNQNNAVTIAEYPANRLLGIRRLYG